MLSPFHIFKVQSDGSLHWIEGAINVERAKARLKVLAACSCGEYVITDLTGKKISTKSLPKLAVLQRKGAGCEGRTVSALRPRGHIRR